jgi:periplasmic copper chaperone A
MDKLWIAGAALALVVGSAQSAEIKVGALTLRDPVVRASLGRNPNTAAYLTVANSGAKSDQLLSASCACAATVEAHATMNHNNMMSMMPVRPLVIAPHASLTFKPGGLHLMVTGLKAPLVDGQVQEMTLRFEHAGAIKVPFKVQARIDAPAR